MQTWATRGVQAAFVTGGLLALGTGVASAQEGPAIPEVPSVTQAVAHTQLGDSGGSGDIGDLGNLARFGDPGNTGNLDLVEDFLGGNGLDEVVSEFGAAAGDSFGLDHFAGLGQGDLRDVPLVSESGEPVGLVPAHSRDALPHTIAPPGGGGAGLSSVSGDSLTG
jgi:hypothetical protein